MEELLLLRKENGFKLPSILLQDRIGPSTGEREAVQEVLLVEYRVVMNI